MANYRSAHRQRQAEATRDEIVRAARRLFVERGYAATTMSDIAAEAGVAVQTIYASCGSKRDLVLALTDLIDQEAGVAELGARLRAAATPREVLSLGVTITARIQERCGDIVGVLISAAAVEEEAAAAMNEGLVRHRAGTRAAVRRIAKLGGLREGLGAERAATAIAVLSSPAVYAQLREQHGWSVDQCRDWIEDSLARLILREP
jgi:AcrR family transcriptional regulator